MTKTYNNEIRARALLSIAGDRFGKAQAIAGAYQAISDALGPHTAAWAYAGNRSPGTGAAVAVSAWGARGQPGVLILSGFAGTSKTTTAARYVAEAGGGLIRADCVNRWSYEGREFAAYLRPPILLIDDIGTEQAEGRGAGHLVSLISTRADYGRPTVMTSMLTLEAFRARYSAQVISRCLPGFVRLTDSEDLRQQGTGIVADLDGYQRQRQLAQLARVIQAVADRTVYGDRAREAITRAEELVAELYPRIGAQISSACAKLEAEDDDLLRQAEVTMDGWRNELAEIAKPAPGRETALSPMTRAHLEVFDG